MGGYTPGPWAICETMQGEIGIAADGIWVIAVKHGALYDPKGEANARLIAAAPALLEACANWINWLKPDAPWRDDAADHEERMLDAMRAAISLARGEVK